MASKTFSTQGIVLKRFNTGETDRILTILSEDKGKLVCVAKGVRKIRSTQRAFLEPGNTIKAFLVKTKSMPLLVQTEIIQDAFEVRSSLTKISQLAQILEVFDRLFVENDIDPETYVIAKNLIALLIKNENTNRKIKQELGSLLVLMGYQHPSETSHNNIADYMSHITERKMRSFEYLRVK